MENKISAFQLRIMAALSHEIKIASAQKNITKHEYIENAIKEQLKRDQQAV